MKTAIEVLLDAFENSMCKDANQKSRSQYRSVIAAQLWVNLTPHPN